MGSMSLHKTCAYLLLLPIQSPGCADACASYVSITESERSNSREWRLGNVLGNRSSENIHQSVKSRQLFWFLLDTTPFFSSSLRVEVIMRHPASVAACLLLCIVLVGKINLKWFYLLEFHFCFPKRFIIGFFVPG